MELLHQSVELISFGLLRLNMVRNPPFKHRRFQLTSYFPQSKARWLAKRLWYLVRSWVTAYSNISCTIHLDPDANLNACRGIACAGHRRKVVFRVDKGTGAISEMLCVKPFE